MRRACRFNTRPEACYKPPHLRLWDPSNACPLRVRRNRILLATPLASAQPAPPTFVQMPYLGVIDPNTGALRSFDSGKQPVGTSSFYKEWFYQFNLDASQGATLRGFIEQGAGLAATIEVQDAGHRTLGPLAGPLPKLGTGTYYIDGHPVPTTNFLLRQQLPPPLLRFPTMPTLSVGDGLLFITW